MIAYRAKPVATITNKAAKIHRKGFRVNCSSRIKISEITDQLKVTSKYLAPATSLLGKMPHTYRLVHRSTALCARSSCQIRSATRTDARLPGRINEIRRL